MIWVKVIHLAAIAIWSAGLICLPGLYVQRAHVPNAESLHRLQSMVRFMYVAIVSPAAFVAVGSGTALVFLREAWVPWFSLKLAFVGMMVFLHILGGLVIIRLFEEGRVYPVWRFVSTTAVTVVLVTIVLVIVLSKPDLPSLLPSAMSEPGALGRIADGLNPLP
jgi:uncharacterized membrane protein